MVVMEDNISLVDHLVLVCLCPFYIRRTHYPVLEKRGTQNIAVCENQGKQSKLSDHWKFIKTLQCCIQQFFGGAGFLKNKKPLCNLGVWGHYKPSPVGSRGKAPENFGYFAFWIAQNMTLVTFQQWAHCGTSASTVICLFLNELIFTLLRVWESEFGIPDRYTAFKIALDAALHCFWKE